MDFIAKLDWSALIAGTILLSIALGPELGIGIACIAWFVKGRD